MTGSGGEGFEVEGVGFDVWVLGFRVLGFKCVVQVSGFRVYGRRLRV